MAPIKVTFPASEGAKGQAFARLNFWASQPMRCSCCKRVCGFIYKDGICGSPKCRKGEMIKC